MEAIYEQLDALYGRTYRQGQLIEELMTRVTELERRLRESEAAEVIDFPMSSAAEDRLAIDRRA